MAENKEIGAVDITEDEAGVFHIESEEEVAPPAKETETAKWEEKYLYLRADFENYKKRVQKEQLDQSKFANEKILKDVLVVLDNLERALLHFNEPHYFEKANVACEVSEGLTLISKQFVSFLNRFGVTPIESLNKPFDPECHQAVGHVERADLPEGSVAEEVQKGYMLYDRLIRPSFVMISKKDENSALLGGTVDVGV